MSDSEDSDNHIYDYKSFDQVSEEIQRRKKNPETSQMFVSGWDDADQDLDLVKDPKANPIDHVLWAAENGEIETLQSLLASQPNLIKARDGDGYTPLHRAAYGNHLQCVSYLLSLNADIKAKTELGWTPLHSACNWNNYKVAARLLAANADPGALSDGDQTPLHLAAAVSHSKSTLLVLLFREDIVKIVNKENNSGETPGHLAQGHGIYGLLFDMASPAATQIRNIAFTCNPYTRS